MSEQAEQVAEAAADAEDIIQVRLKTLNDREALVSISKQRTVNDLVEAARNQLQIITGNQRIIFQGRVLEPEAIIETVGLENGHTVHLVDRAMSSNNSRPSVIPNPIPGVGTRVLPPFVPRPTPPEQRTDPHVLPPIRVPPNISSIPVLSSRFDMAVIRQETMSLRFRRQGINRPPSRDLASSPYSEDPHAIHWIIKIREDLMFTPRNQFTLAVKNLVYSLPFVESSILDHAMITFNETAKELKVELPQVPSHIPSPALEKLDFVCFWTEILKKFLDKCLEPDGLCEIVHQVVEMAREKAPSDGLMQSVRERKIQELDLIARDLELISSELCHMKDYERERFKKNNTQAYKSLKIQEYQDSGRNPRFFMRHALDTDYTVASRDLREQQLRFSALEEMLDDMLDHGVMKYARESMSSNRDYRYQSISMFYHYVQRMRHHIAHITHVQSELDVSFLTPSSPQRLLPQYSSSLTIPASHACTLIFKLVPQTEQQQLNSVPITHILEPPRVASDVGNRVQGEWPYLPFNTPGVSADAILAPPRRVADPRQATGTPRAVVQMTTEYVDDVPTQQFFMAQGPPARGRPVFMGEAALLQDLIAAQQEQIEAVFAQNPTIETARVRVTARPRRVITTGDAPSVPVETMPPPVNWVATNSRQSPAQYNSRTETQGPSTATLQPTPAPIESSELQRISRHIAARYREDALRRIATNLTARFNEERWDTRLQNMPLCTLRESVALCLELLASAGSTPQESEALMLALVRDEEVLVRAIAESVKSLFGRGEFPTHLSRIITPRNETASSRTDYEAVEGEEAQADELETMVVRMPSDISQPQSGDLRALRDRRNSRRQFLENRGGPVPSTSTPPVAGPVGPSFNTEDAAAIRAGRLPGGTRVIQRTRPGRRAPEPAAPTPPAPAAASAAPAPPAPVASPVAERSIPPGAFPPITPTGPPQPRSLEYRQLTPQQVMMSWIPPPQPEAGGAAGQLHLQFNTTGFFSSSPPTPRRSSAPATVTNSPVRNPEETGVNNWESSTGPGTSGTSRGNEQARAARAHIDRLAAMFNGPAPTAYLPGTWNPRTARTMPVQPPANMNQRTMAAIDPYMHCGNRHCELHRMQDPSQLPDAERYTLQSLQPDPELEAHLAPTRSVLQRRPQQTAEDDEDYNYDVLRSNQGVLAFKDLNEFLRFLRTMCRSILSHAVDTDSIMSLNMNNISGYSAVNPIEMMAMIRRSLNSPGSNYSIPSIPSRPAARTDHPLMAEVRPVDDRIQREGPLAQSLNNALAQARVQRNPSNARRSRTREEMNAYNSMQMSAYLTFLYEYLEDARNTRPPGLFGFLLNLAAGNFSRHDYALLPRASSAPNVIVEYADVLQRQIIRDHLNGRTDLSNSELHRIASRIANNEEFYAGFLAQNPSFRQLIELNTAPNERAEMICTAVAFHKIEVALIKAILTMAQMDLTPVAFIPVVIHSFQRYLYRNFVMFYRLANRDRYRQRQHIHRIPDFLASIRFRDQPNLPMDNFLDIWHRIVDHWFEVHHGVPENDLIAFLRAGNDWNDATELTAGNPPPPLDDWLPYGTRDSETPGTSGTPGTSATSATPSTPSNNTVALQNPRKRNHDGTNQSDDGVDVVAPMMTSLSTSSPSTSSAPAPEPADDEIAMETDNQS